ncbi:MAG: metallopeptidase family protein [Verrucomicrobiales bacterium]
MDDDLPAELESWAEDAMVEYFAQLDETLRPFAREVTLIYQWEADENNPEEEDLLGLFEGPGREDYLAGEGELPPRITLFLENLWWEAEADAQRFRDEVQLTFLHELGHYLGYEEDDLIKRGIG